MIDSVAFTAVSRIGKGLFGAWRDGGKKVRTVIVVSLSLLVLCVVALTASEQFQDGTFWDQLFKDVALALGIIGGAGVMGVSAWQEMKAQDRKERRIEEVERKVQENPKEPQAAWELARIKLESYLDRNLAQVGAIFWLTTVVMLAGFILIGIGVYEAFTPSNTFNASVLTVASGVIVNFIGGTFLVLYKATMSQAKDYVSILERINAVGMSVQIIENIEDGDLKLRYETTAHIAKELLVMYAGHGDSDRVRNRRRKD